MKNRSAKFAIVLNRAAGTLRGRHKNEISTWAEELSGESFMHIVKPGHISKTLRNLSARGVKRIALGGGDGTFSRSAEFLIAEGIELVPLPLGTLNHFARDMEMTTDPSDWLEITKQGISQPVDVGILNKRLFINNFSIGLYPRLVKERQDIDGERIAGSKKLATLWTAAKILLSKHRTYNINYRANGAERRQCEVQALMVSNNQYTRTDAMLTGRETIRDGELALYIPENLSPTLIANMTAAVVNNNLSDCDGLQLINAQRLELSFHQRNIRVAVDGELTRMKSPLCVELLPKSLSVVTSRGTA